MVDWGEWLSVTLAEARDIVEPVGVRPRRGMPIGKLVFLLDRGLEMFHYNVMVIPGILFSSRRSLFMVSFLGLIGFVLTSVAAEPLASASVPQLSGSVVLDGKLDEDVWKAARQLTPLVKNSDGSAPREQTKVWLFHDGTALYLAWEIIDQEIQATFTERDSHFWEEEVVEFFLAPTALDTYFELQWNPLGGIFDAIIHNTLDDQGKSRGIEGEWSFTAEGMRSKVSVEGTVSDASDRDRRWTVEAVIPFADLGNLQPVAGTRWRANFYRFNRGKDGFVEKQSWCPTLDPSFHQPSRFGILKF